jgi:hypothetical protein
VDANRNGPWKPQAVARSFVLAEHVYVDARTGNKIIAGTFDTIWMREFPGTLPVSTWVYLALTDCHGRIDVELRFVDLDDYSVLGQLSGMSVEAGDPLMTYEVLMQVPPLPMPKPGWYALEAYCNREQTSSLRLRIAKAVEGQDQKP